MSRFLESVLVRHFFVSFFAVEKKKKDCYYGLIFNRRVHKECTQSTRRVIVFYFQKPYFKTQTMQENHTHNTCYIMVNHCPDFGGYYNKTKILNTPF